MPTTTSRCADGAHVEGRLREAERREHPDRRHRDRQHRDQRVAQRLVRPRVPRRRARWPGTRSAAAGRAPAPRRRRRPEVVPWADLVELHPDVAGHVTLRRPATFAVIFTVRSWSVRSMISGRPRRRGHEVPQRQLARRRAQRHVEHLVERRSRLEPTSDTSCRRCVLAARACDPSQDTRDVPHRSPTSATLRRSTDSSVSGLLPGRRPRRP